MRFVCDGHRNVKLCNGATCYAGMGAKRSLVQRQAPGVHSKADEIKDNEVGSACGTHGRGEKSVQVSVGKAGRKETTRKTEV
jgi:hypothetical protein